MAIDTVKNRKTGKTFGPKEAKADGIPVKQWRETLSTLQEKHGKKMLKHLIFSDSGEIGRAHV